MQLPPKFHNLRRGRPARWLRAVRMLNQRLQHLRPHGQKRPTVVPPSSHFVHFGGRATWSMTYSQMRLHVLAPSPSSIRALPNPFNIRSMADTWGQGTVARTPTLHCTIRICSLFIQCGACTCRLGNGTVKLRPRGREPRASARVQVQKGVDEDGFTLVVRGGTCGFCRVT